MTPGSLFFLFCGIVILVGALSTILAKSPIRSAVGLLATVVGIAGLFLMLEAQFLAAIQLIVYAGAVVVLFVFVVMLLGPDAQDVARSAKTLWARAIGAVLFAALGAVGVALMHSDGQGTPLVAVAPTYGDTETVGRLLFREALVPFEAATVLLVVAVVGAIAVARGRASAKGGASRGGGETRRLFVGPIHPRDAGRPFTKESVR